MHELGVLYQALKTVEKVAEKNNIAHIKHLSLELGQESDCLGEFLEKLFPVAAAEFPFAKGAELRLRRVPGKTLRIIDIGY